MWILWCSRSARSNSLCASGTNRTRISARRGLRRNSGGIEVDGRLRHVSFIVFERGVGDQGVFLCQFQRARYTARGESIRRTGTNKPPEKFSTPLLFLLSLKAPEGGHEHARLSGWVQGQWPCFSRQASLMREILRIGVPRSLPSTGRRCRFFKLKYLLPECPVHL